MVMRGGMRGCDGMYRLSTVADIAKAKRRSVQIWAEAGALQASEETEREGSGVHRLFPESELKIAWAIARVAECGVDIGRLLVFSSALRRVIATLYAGKIIRLTFSFRPGKLYSSPILRKTIWCTR